MFKLPTILLLALVVAMPVLSFANDTDDESTGSTVVRSGESVSIAADQSVEGDFYAAGGTVSMSGTIAEDMYATGGSVTVNGDVKADLTVVGGTAQVHSAVADDVRIVAGEVVIAEPVGGDVFVIGGLLKVLSSAEIAGDVYFFGGEVEIDGPVGGSVFGAAEAFRVNAAVAGNIDVTVSQNLTLGERAAIVGSVNYKSDSELIRSQGAVVEGDVVKGTFDQTTTVDLQDILTPFFVLLFATLILFLFFRDRLQLVADDAIENYTRNGLLGLALLLVTPVVSVLALASVLGILVGLLGMFTLLVLCLAGVAGAAVILAGLGSRAIGGGGKVGLLALIGGVAGFYVILFIPVIGLFFGFILFSIALGTIAGQLYRGL